MRILIVDDEELIRENLAELFRIKGHEPTIAADYKSAEEAWRREKGQFDIVITDNDYPGGGGPKLVELVKKENPNVPIIMITGNDIYKLRENPILSGIQILSKPIRFVTLYPLVLELATGRSEPRDFTKIVSGPCPWAQAHGGLKPKP